MKGKLLDPKTPDEYIEALFRMASYLREHKDEFPDGDGVTDTPEDQLQTKTDLLKMIRGCTIYALECIEGEQIVIKALEEGE